MILSTREFRLSLTRQKMRLVFHISTEFAHKTHTEFDGSNQATRPKIDVSARVPVDTFVLNWTFVYVDYIGFSDSGG